MLDMKECSSIFIFEILHFPFPVLASFFIGIFSLKFATYLTPLIHKINLKINPNSLESDGSEDCEEEQNDSESVAIGR